MNTPNVDENKVTDISATETKLCYQAPQVQFFDLNLLTKGSPAQLFEDSEGIAYS